MSESLQRKLKRRTTMIGSEASKEIEKEEHHHKEKEGKGFADG